MSYPGEEVVYQATVEEAQAVEVRRKHAEAEEKRGMGDGHFPLF